MEKPVLGLAYTKTAALPSWGDVTDWWGRSAPDFLGGDPKAKAVAKGQREQARRLADAQRAREQQTQQGQTQQGQEPPKELTPEQQQAQRLAARRRQGSDQATAYKQLVAKRREARRAAEPALRANRTYMDQTIGEAKDQRFAAMTPEAQGQEIARRQAVREDNGNWAYEAARNMEARNGHGTRPGVPNFAGRGTDMSFNIASDRAAAEAPGRRLKIPRSPVSGMSNTDFVYTVNDFMDKQNLEGQGAGGLSLDSFDRYMERRYPGQRAASRAKYDKPEIRWGENDTPYQAQGRSVKPISWQPTTMEQARRMGVISNSGKLQPPGASLPIQLRRPPGRLARTFDTEDQLRADGVDPNGPQGWRYDEARRKQQWLRAPGVATPAKKEPVEPRATKPTPTPANTSTTTAPVPRATPVAVAQSSPRADPRGDKVESRSTVYGG